MLFRSSYTESVYESNRQGMTTYVVDKVTQTTKGQDEKINLLNKTSLSGLVVNMKILLQFRRHIDDL
jgi:hypothetical protein